MPVRLSPELCEDCFNLIWYFSFFPKKQGGDISKLALHFTLRMEDIPTTLVSTASIQNLQKNIDAVSETLTEEERNCMEFIRDKYVHQITLTGQSTLINKAVLFLLSDVILSLTSQMITFLSSIFKPVGNLSWEGVEVAKYWRKIKELQAKTSPV